MGATIALLVPLGVSQSWLLPVLAFAGAWGATVLVIGVSRVAGAVDAAGMLLAGVAVAAVLGALRSFLMLALSDETVSLQVVLSWVLGGIQTPTWMMLGLLAVISAGCFALTLLFAGGLDVLGLGETMAIGFGLDVKRFVAIAVLAGSVVVAAAVAFGGLVAFVGLAAPHIARWLVGPMHRPLLPASALVGASIVTIADAIARSALPPPRFHLAWSPRSREGLFSFCSWRGGSARDWHRSAPRGPAARQRDVARGPVAVPWPDRIRGGDRSQRRREIDADESARRDRDTELGAGSPR